MAEYSLTTNPLIDVDIFRQNISEAEKTFNSQVVRQQQFIVAPGDRKIGIMFNEKNEVIGITKSNGHTVKISATTNTLNDSKITLDEAIIIASTLEHLKELGEHTGTLLLRNDIDVDNQFRSTAYVRTGESNIAMAVNQDLKASFHVKNDLPFFDNIPKAVNLDTPLNTIEQQQDAQLRRSLEDRFRATRNKTQEKEIYVEEMSVDNEINISQKTIPEETILELKEWLYKNPIQHPIKLTQIGEFKALWEKVRPYRSSAQNDTDFEEEILYHMSSTDEPIDTESTSAKSSESQSNTILSNTNRADRLRSWIKKSKVNTAEITMLPSERLHDDDDDSQIYSASMSQETHRKQPISDDGSNIERTQQKHPNNPKSDFGNESTITDRSKKTAPSIASSRSIDNFDLNPKKRRRDYRYPSSAIDSRGSPSIGIDSRNRPGTRGSPSSAIDSRGSPSISIGSRNRPGPLSSQDSDIDALSSQGSDAPSSQKNRRKRYETQIPRIPKFKRPKTNTNV